MIASLYADATKLHDVSDAALNRAVRDFDLGSPAPRRIGEDLPNRHGERDDTRWYGGRVFPLAGTVKGATEQAALEQLDIVKAALQLGTSGHVIKFTRSGFAFAERFVDVKVAAPVDAPLAGLHKKVRYSTQLLAADPRIYKDAATESSYAPSTGGTGVSFTLTFPLDFIGAAGSTAVLTNNGNTDTPVVWTITGGPASGLAIVNETTGERLTFKATFELGASDSLVVDVKARSVTLNGTSRPDLIDTSRTTWWYLPAGASTVRLAATSLTAGVTTLAWSFRDARI